MSKIQTLNKQLKQAQDETRKAKAEITQLKQEVKTLKAQIADAKLSPLTRAAKQRSANETQEYARLKTVNLHKA